MLARALAERGDRAPRAEVGRALAGLTRGESVAAVAAEVGYSRRRLGTLVREECGLTPKEYQRVARFERAHGLLGHRPLAEVAACVRVRRPGPPRAGVAGAGRVHADDLAARGVPVPPRPHRARRGRLRAMTTLWHTLTVDDADAMIAWLGAVGFTELATYRDESDPSVVVHAEWLWGGSGGVMFGSRRPGGHDQGPASAYLVTDDPDAVVDRAVAAGATGAAGGQRPRLRRARRQRSTTRRATTGPWGYSPTQPALTSLPVAVRAVRGATQLDVDDREHMLERVAEMVLDVMSANGLDVDDFISVIFTATSRPGLGVPGVRRAPARASATCR